MRREKRILYSILILLCLQSIAVFPKFVYSSEDFQAAFDDKTIETISLRRNISGNFVCRRGNVRIDGEGGYTLSAEDSEKPVLFFDGPDFNRHNDIHVKNLTFSTKNTALHIQNYNHIVLERLSFSGTKIAILLDGCFNTAITVCSFSTCDTCIILNSGARHHSGSIEIDNCQFKNFGTGIYDNSTADKSPGQDVVQIKNCTIQEHPDFWPSFIDKANANGVWNNPKDMVLSHRYFFENTLFDREIIPYSSNFYESDNKNLAQEITIIFKNTRTKLESLSSTVGRPLDNFYDAYEGFKVKKMEGIVGFLNDPKTFNLRDFFEHIVQLTNETLFNSRYEYFVYGWSKDWDVDDGPLFELFSTKSMGWQYLAPVSLILSHDFQYLVDFAKQSKYCFVHNTPLSEWLQELSVTDSEFFKKSVILYNALFDKEEYCLSVLNQLINFSVELKKSAISFKDEYQEYIEAYNDYILALLFDVPLQIIALGVTGEIMQQQDQKEYLAELAQRFSEMYAIKNRFSKLETTARTYDKILELFKKYLKNEDYNKLNASIKQDPLWLIQDMDGYITSVQ